MSLCQAVEIPPPLFVCSANIYWLSIPSGSTKCSHVLGRGLTGFTSHQLSEYSQQSHQVGTLVPPREVKKPPRVTGRSQAVCSHTACLWLHSTILKPLGFLSEMSRIFLSLPIWGLYRLMPGGCNSQPWIWVTINSPLQSQSISHAMWLNNLPKTSSIFCHSAAIKEYIISLGRRRAHMSPWDNSIMTVNKTNRGAKWTRTWVLGHNCMIFLSTNYRQKCRGQASWTSAEHRNWIREGGLSNKEGGGCKNWALGWLHCTLIYPSFVILLLPQLYKF